VGYNRSTITVNSGRIGGYLKILSSAIGNLSGGSVGNFYAESGGRIYIYGVNFEVDGVSINHSASLRG